MAVAQPTAILEWMKCMGLSRDFYLLQDGCTHLEVICNSKKTAQKEPSTESYLRRHSKKSAADSSR